MTTQEWIEQIEQNQKTMDERDRRAKENGKLVGRYVREQIADGYAFYRIVRENKNSVRIRVITGVGDDWQIPYWGEETTIPKDYALRNIGFRDRIESLFSGKSN